MTTEFGQWVTYKDGANPWWVVRSDNGDDALCDVHVVVWNNPQDQIQVERVARLIAAAPELLEALQTTLSNLDTIIATQPGIKTYDKWRDMVCDAIANAVQP